MPAARLKVESVPVDSLTPHERNPRQGDVGAITESLTEFGQYAPIVVQKSSGRIIAGNHRWLAAKALGWERIEVVRLDVDDVTAERILVADNRLSDLATYDEQALADLLAELAAADALTGTGYDGDDVDSLLQDVADRDPVNEYTQAVVSPVYEPTGPCPPVESLVDTRRRDELLPGIEEADIPDAVRVFLTVAAARHNRFDYQAIAEFYAHATPDVQRLMEESALIIIDFDQAIEQGFVRMNDAIDAAFQEDYPDA